MQLRDSPLRRVGHKGADAILPGNTVASFEAGAAAGVEMIEFDVLWTPDGHPSRPPDSRSPLAVAHDWEAAQAAERSGARLTLDQALEAFTGPALSAVEINCDLKLPGREEELVGSLRSQGLTERSMVSTMEISSLERIARLDPGLRRGWTYPKVTRDWTAHRWAAPALLGAMVVMRRGLPGLARKRLAEMGVDAMWVYHPLITERLAEVTSRAGVELIAWTVDDTGSMRKLIASGVDGICSNDPRLFGQLP